MRIKINRKMGISKKLFIITTIVFGIFISGTLIVQSLFFERFYISKKKSDLANTVEKFVEVYKKESSAEKADELIEEYEQDYNLNIVIMDKAYNIKYLTKSNKNKFDQGKKRELTEFIRQWVKSNNVSDSVKSENKITTLMNQKRIDSPGNIIAIAPNNQKEEVIFALTSLQPVNEAVTVIEQFYKYFYAGAFVFILILALVYSKMIVKPLLKINKAATKMANLDFSEKCKIESEDEIGNVATSLNFLSENLSEALTSLRKANTKLEGDIEKERNLEKMRKEFIAAVSHELKTPISLIDGYAVGLKDNIFEGEEKDFYLDIIIDEAEKMGSLVSEMLDLSHLESGSFKLNKEEFNLTELIKFTLKKYKSLMEEKSIRIELNLMECVMVYGDWNRLEQVLTNFITNALRHVNEKGTIFVNMVDEDKDIAIVVENTGSNIPENEILKVWDKFYKIDKARTRKLGGTGIGLSIVKNILTLHGYSFRVENTTKGVKFSFNVPKE